MALTDLSSWLDERRRAPSAWFVKRLQANDTLATGSHQAGPYLPKPFLFAVHPALRDEAAKNPRVEFDIYIDSQGDYRRVRAIWYNNRLHGGTRNETRITGFDGARSDLLDPESTGAIAVLAFDLADPSAPVCHAWVCRDETESDLVEATVGQVDPGTSVTWIAEGTPHPGRFILPRRRKSVPLAKSGEAPVPPHGRNEPPTVEMLVSRSALAHPLAGQPVDTRLLRRHEAFLDLFRQLEHELYAPSALNGFPDIASLLETADHIRAGRQARDDGLALQLRYLLTEDGLTEGSAFSFRPSTGTARNPDFVFAAIGAGADVQSGTILLVEPVIRDRWKAAVEESGATRVHMLTLQRGVSLTQFNEMAAAGVTLVVPARLHDTYPSEIRSDLMSLESFIADVRHLAAPVRRRG
ncbi:type II restriction endonuclease [Sphingomonas sp. 179-A 2A2 NHS]|uniref:type II restriction endonuclease n=1 Tax=Sphingomonas sp. 179-A 2A2 NHS TaxID=3374290 RepID=UPI003879F985